jgi:hypothetical protein
MFRLCLPQAECSNIRVKKITDLTVFLLNVRYLLIDIFATVGPGIWELWVNGAIEDPGFELWSLNFLSISRTRARHIDFIAPTDGQGFAIEMPE